HLAWAGIDLLMRHERWHIDKVARSCFRSEFEMLAPAHPCPPPDDVNHGLQFAMMVWARFGVGLDRKGAGPQFARTGPGLGSHRVLTRASQPRLPRLYKLTPFKKLALTAASSNVSSRLSHF